MEYPRPRGLRQAKDRQEQLARGVAVVEHGVSVLMQLAHMMDEESRGVAMHGKVLRQPVHLSESISKEKGPSPICKRS